MDTEARIQAADEQSRELLRTFSSLEHRIQAFVEMQAGLAQLHDQLGALRKELSAVKAAVQQVQSQLPSVARKEELARIQQKIDAIPFETMVTKRDV